MPKDHPFVGGDEVASILQTLGRGGAQGVERKYFCGDEPAVETITESVRAYGRDYQPHRIDLLTAVQGNGSHRQSAEEGDSKPDQEAKEFWHGSTPGSVSQCRNR